MERQAHGVARHQVRRQRIGSLPRELLQRALLDDAGHAARCVAVGDRAGADDAARAESARTRRIAQDVDEAEVLVVAGAQLAAHLAVDLDAQPAEGAALAPVGAQLVGRDGEGAEGARGLAVEEAEAFGQFARDQRAQRDVVDQHQQPHLGQRLLGRGRGAQVADDHGQFALEVGAPGRVGGDVLAPGEVAVRQALVDDRLGARRRRHLGAARAAHALHVRQVAAGIDPLVGARQRRQQRREFERLARGGVGVEPGRGRAQQGRRMLPIVECGLQGGCGFGHREAAPRIGRHHHELAVAPAVVQRREPHAVTCSVLSSGASR